jgi:hypothetical protein
MTMHKVLGVMIVLWCICIAAPVVAEENPEESGGLLQSVMDALGSAAKDSLQEQMDEWIGTYKGRLGEVQLVERRGNAVVLDVTYEKVKRSDGVYVQGEVLSNGIPIDGFSNTLTQVSGKRGRVRLTLSRSESSQDDWGLASPDIDSDQVKLFLVRESHEDRPFGSIVYDLPKTWTASNDIEVLEAAPAEEPAGQPAIELAEEGQGGVPPAASRPVLVGTILKPAAVPSVAGTTAVKPAPAATIGTSRATAALPASPSPSTSTGTVKPIARTDLVAVQATIDHYDLYSEAAKAQWRSGAGVLPCPGSASDARGFVRRLERGKLHTGNAAIQLLQTHPQWVGNGHVAGFYPAMFLAPGVHFKTVIGFLQGAGASDGATFTVQVYENGRYQRVFRRTLRADRYANVDVDLSRWAGKKINLILRVDSGASSTQDWAVWVKPRLSR